MFDSSTKNVSLRGKISDPLIKNSLYLMLNALSGTGSGFIFWVFAARFYSAEDVGLAAAITSAMVLISTFSKLGFDIGIMKYLPKAKEKNGIINSCLTIIFLASIALSIAFIIVVERVSPALIFIRQNSLYLILFIIFSAANSLFMTYSYIFAALRNTKYSFYQNLIAISRIIFLPIFMMFNFIGLYMSYGLGVLFASISGVYFIKKINSSYSPAFEIKKSNVTEMINYSSANYIATIFEGFPSFVLPIVVVNVLGAELNAYFYIAWAFSMVLLMIPRATSISLFAEGGHSPEDFKNNSIRALKFIYLTLLPLISLFIIFGKDILSIFGSGYSENSFQILSIFSLASVPYSMNILNVTIKRVQKKITQVIYIHGFISIFSVIGAYIFMTWYGLVGVAIAWFIGNIIASLFSAFSILKELVVQKNYKGKTDEERYFVCSEK